MSPKAQKMKIMVRYRYSAIHVISFISRQQSQMDYMEIQSIVKIPGFPRKAKLLASTATNVLQTYTHYVEHLQARSALVSLIAKWRCGKFVRVDERGEFLESSDCCVSRQWSGWFFRNRVWWNGLNFYRSYGSHKRHQQVRAREGEGLLRILTYIWRAT